MISCLLSSPAPPPSRAAIACRFVRNVARPAIRIPLNDIDYNGIGCNKRFFNAIQCGLWVGLLPNNQRSGRYSIGAVKDSCAEGQEDSDEVTGDELQAVIRQNKQVLSIESNLKEQITEGRKCIPSIHDSTITKENEANAYNVSEGSIPNLDMNNHGDPDGTNEYWTSSDSLAESTKAGVVGHEEKLINDFEIEHSNLGQYSVLPKEEEAFSYQQIHGSLSNLDMTNQGEVDKTKDSWTDTDSFTESTEVDVVDGNEKLIDVLEFEQFMPDDLGGTVQTNLDQYNIITKKESDSYDQNHGPHSDLGINGNRELDNLHDSWTSSESFAQSTEAVVDEHTNYLEVEKSKEDSLERLSQNNLEQSQSVLSYLSDMPHSCVLMDNNLEISTEANTHGSRDHSEVLLDEGILQPSPLAGSNVMNVIVVAAECAPWSKTGGLGDVVGDLPKALARRGHRVMVVAPKYGNYAEAKEVGLLKRYKAIGQDLEVTYYHAYIDSVDFVFIDSPIFRHIGNNIYGGNRQDILKRMILFCKAAVEVPWYVPCGGVCYGDGNLVFVANDWHTALLPVYLKACYRDNGVMIYVRSVLVIHNIAHQGRGPVDDFSCLDLPYYYIDRFKLYDPVGGEHLNILAAGLKSADRVITVSHSYAWELRTTEGGWGLHSIINEIGWKLHGIVNGIDVKNWNPMFDVHLTSDGYTNYDVESLQVGKAQCKAALQREFGLPVRSDVPIIAFIGRLDGQKGVELIIEAKHWFAGQDLQLIMLGTGRRDLEDMLRRFEGEHRHKVRGWVGFSDKLAHRITAGADVLLMPSRFEPCGLNQLYAMMYGTVPVVHSVGGLRDTVQQFDPFNERGLGWTFDPAQTHKMIEALNHCMITYRYHRKSWEGLQVRGMAQDLSWDNAAKRYEEVLVAAKYQW